MKISPQNFLKTLFVCCLIAMSISVDAQVLDLESTTEGALLPRMTTAQRTAITSASDSEIVYDTDTNTYWYFDDGWIEIATNNLLNGTYTDDGSDAPGSPITDNNTTTSTIALTDPNFIQAGDVITICLDITHTFVGDLGISLIAPDGSTTMDLTSGNGSSGDNFTNTCFTTTATISITTILASDAPFTGDYLPETLFNVLIGQSIAGNWTLSILDQGFGDEGTLNSWSIEISAGNQEVNDNKIVDSDLDTKIEVDLDDSDEIKFTALNYEPMVIDSGSVNIDGTLTINPAPLAKNSIVELKSFPADSAIVRFFEAENLGIEWLYDGVDNEMELKGFVGNNIYGPHFLVKRNNGQIAMGGETYANDHQLSVHGKIACEELLVALVADWPDYVFKDDYNLLSLSEVESHIKEFGHLPNVPSAKEVEDHGIEVGEMNKILMEKVEELTLYIIELEKKYDTLEEKLKDK